MDLSIKSILHFTQNFWKGIGNQEALMITDDSINGIMQDGMRDLQYISEQYKKYKANGMRAFGRGKKKAVAGKRLNDYQGVSIINTDISKVNMQLTGQTLKGLTNNIKPHDDGMGVTISYDLKDADKIFGNQDRGRNIVGLRKENQDMIYQEILKSVDENIRTEFEGSFQIDITT